MRDTIEISNGCTCTEYQCEDCDNYMLVSPDEDATVCDMCGSEDITDTGAPYDCPCCEENPSLAQEIWETWTETHPAPYGWYICDGSGLGWQNRSGLKPLNAEVDDILDEFSLDTDWTMHFPTFEDAKSADTFHITRSHHDSPMGEGIEIKPANFEEAVWCIEWSDEMADSWIDAIENLFDQKYEVGLLSDEKVIEICDNADIDPTNYLQDPEKFGYSE